MNAAASSVVQAKNEADALIAHDVLGQVFLRYALTPEAAQSSEGQRYLQHLALWTTTAAAAHVRLGTRDLATVTHRFATGIVPLRGEMLTHALDQFVQAMVAVNPDLGEMRGARFALNPATRQQVEACLLRHPSFANSRVHGDAVHRVFHGGTTPTTPVSRPRGP